MRAAKTSLADSKFKRLVRQREITGKGAKSLPSPGEGPDKEAREKGSFKTLLVALSDGKAERTIVADRRDPGYGSTAVMLSEAAMCLALEGPQLECGGGILTPATAMGMRLVERLRAAGMTFEVQA